MNKYKKTGVKIYRLDAYEQDLVNPGYVLSSTGTDLYTSVMRYENPAPVGPPFLGPGTFVTHKYVDSNYTFAYTGFPAVQQLAPGLGGTNFAAVSLGAGLWMKRGGVLDFAVNLTCNVPVSGSPPLNGVNIKITPPAYAGNAVPIGGLLGEVRGTAIFMKNSANSGGTNEPMYQPSAAPYIRSLSVSTLAGGGILFNIQFNVLNWTTIRNNYSPFQTYNIVGSGATQPAPTP